MKRYGNLYDKIYDMDNLFLAYQKARKGKSKSHGVILFEKDFQRNMMSIYEDLQKETYATSEYEVFKIFDPKEREIYRLPFRDRIVQHAIMNILEPIWTSVFISHTYSCIKGKGIHGALKHIRRDMKDVSGTVYCLKMDIRKFYPSIDHDIMKSIIRKKIKDNQLLNLLDSLVDSAPGVPIGNYLSQFLANLYLAYLDHWLKEKKQVKYYYRYADDLVILHESKSYLHELLNDIRIYLKKELKLDLKGNYQVFPVESRGIDFVGYVFRHGRIRMRKSIKKNFCRRVAKLNKKDLTEKEYRIKVCSWLGWAKHCDSRNLLKTIINMNKFSDFGIKTGNNYKFNVPEVTLMQIINSEIEVMGYETDVKTRHGNDRYVVKIRFEGEERKFFTSAKPIKEALDKIPESDFPFTTIIKLKKCGSDNEKTYQFT